MKQLSAADTNFLNMETSTQFGHVSSLIVVDPSTSRGGDIYGDLRQAFEERLHLMEVYRRKLAGDVLGLDNPYWVDDPDLDFEFHIREIALPRPGSDQQMGEQVSRIMARSLDRSRPLWEWYVISGMADGMVAILTKQHHATVDGATGVELIQLLLDTNPEGRDIPPAGPYVPERTPGQGELLGRALLTYFFRPQKIVETQFQMIRSMVQLSRSRVFRDFAVGSVSGLPRRLPLIGGLRDVAEQPKLPTRAAPKTPFNKAITAHRRFAFCTLSLSDAQRVKRRFEVTVNDVVMALCAGALRRYLMDHNVLPEKSLVAMVPVSVRAEDEANVYSNRVAAVFSPLYTELPDPVERLMGIHRSMSAAKELHRAIPATMLTDAAQFTPPLLASQANRLLSSTRFADRMSSPVNVVISNVPGPRQPLYLSGALMRHFYPVSSVTEGMGLNMTVQSYLDNLDFGFIACRELVPDLWDLCNHLAEAMEELLKAAAT